MKVPGVAMTDNEVIALSEYLNRIGINFTMSPRRVMHTREETAAATRAVQKVQLEAMQILAERTRYESED